MAIDTSISVMEATAPRITKQLLDFRNDSITVNDDGTIPSQTPVDITGYTFQLIIKRQPVGVNEATGYPQDYDADTYRKTYSGTILDAEEGTFYFDLDLAATSCYGAKPAEIRWWNDTADLTGPPTDRVLIDFIVTKTLDNP